MPTLLRSILNLRDAGQTVNEFTGYNYVSPGKLFRSARPDECTVEDRRLLLNTYGIKAIVDLRTKTEHIEQAQKRDAKIESSEVVPQSNDDLAEPLKIPGVIYHEINFNGWAFSKALMRQLSWWNLIKLILFMMLGYRKDAISIIGTNVMRARGLVGLALDSIDACSYEVLQGKDRTGLTIMLCLLLLGVPLDAIKHDYMLSQKELNAEREERLREIRSIGLGDDFGDCAPEMIDKVSAHLKKHYGGVQGYLKSVGVTEEMQDSVRKILKP